MQKGATPRDHKSKGLRPLRPQGFALILPHEEIIMFTQEAVPFTHQDAESHLMARWTNADGDAAPVERQDVFLDRFRQGCEGIKDLLVFD